MSAPNKTSEAAAQAAVGAAARQLHLTTIRDEATRLAQIAVRERQTHRGFLAEVLTAEVDDRAERRRVRRLALRIRRRRLCWWRTRRRGPGWRGC